MKIAVCDDDEICRTQVVEIIEDYKEECHGTQITFNVFSDPKSLLNSVREGKKYDVYILDIVMNEINGIQLGQSIRAEKGGADSKIIYLTNSKEYALDAFKIRAFDYLLKPVEKESFCKAMDEVVNLIHIKQDKNAIIKTRDGNARISFDRILYVELSNRNLIYHLADGVQIKSTTIRGSFTEAISELIEDSRFVQCGASVLVNLYHITSIENEGVIFRTSERIYLNKKLCRELRGTWNNFWILQEG